MAQSACLDKGRRKKKAELCSSASAKYWPLHCCQADFAQPVTFESWGKLTTAREVSASADTYADTPRGLPANRSRHSLEHYRSPSRKCSEQWYGRANRTGGGGSSSSTLCPVSSAFPVVRGWLARGCHTRAWEVRRSEQVRGLSHGEVASLLSPTVIGEPQTDCLSLRPVQRQARLVHR